MLLSLRVILLSIPKALKFLIMYRIVVIDTFLGVGLQKVYRPGSDAALPNLKKSRRVSIAGGDRKKGGF